MIAESHTNIKGEAEKSLTMYRALDEAFVKAAYEPLSQSAALEPPPLLLRKAHQPSPYMSNAKDETEFKLWAEADTRQKSFVVQVLHWFHYRPTRLRASWKQEEVLTWELIRAFEILPQSIFLQPLLERIATRSTRAQVAITPLLGRDRVEVTPYPSLGLSGGKRNCKSDIGLGQNGQPTVWIEAKTAKFKESDLRAQLQQQESSMSVLMPDRPTVLVTLLPESRALDTFPNLSWDDVLAALHVCGNEVAASIQSPDLSYGYREMVRELSERIESHPGRKSGWV